MPTTPAVEPAALAGLLEDVKQRPTYSAYLRASREIERLGTAAEQPGHRRLRVAVLSTHTIEPLVAALRVDGYRGGLALEFHVAAYGRFFEEVMNGASGLYAFGPDAILVLLEPAALLPQAAGHVGPDDVPLILRRVEQLVSDLKRQTRASVLLSNFILLDAAPFSIAPDSVERAFQELNAGLRQTYARDPQVIVLDLDGLAAYHGRVHSSDLTLRYLAGMPLSESFLPLAGEKVLTVLRALSGLARKCLVVDLDNTLWGGILGEAGPEGIALGPEAAGRAYLDVQRAILRLREKGVLLAVNSKNNRDEVLRVLREHPHMLLREEHFASLQIDWSPKPDQMRRLAQELNIGLESLVFIDDDPAERLQMSMRLPEVLTVEMPGDPAAFPRTLLSLSVFEQPAVTDEDRLRTGLYAAERRRDAARRETRSFEEFLRDLRMRATIRLADAGDAARVAQLTQKTNQFNLTTRRHQAGEIAAMLQDPARRVYTLRLRDAFGDSGLTGVAIVKAGASEWFIDTFLMSCRIIGRTVETVFLNELIRDAERAGAAWVLGEYLPTSKNGLVKDFYSNAGFVTPDHGQHWSLEVGVGERPAHPWIEVER